MAAAEVHVRRPRRARARPASGLCRAAALGLVLALPGCGFVRSMPARMAEPVLRDVAASVYRQTDLELARDGLPAFILLIDGLLQSDPDNPDLLVAAAQAYSSYAGAFVEDEDEARATKLYATARRYGERLLRHNKAMDRAWSKDFDTFQAAVATTTQRDLPGIFWTASSWASWINCNSGSADALADLPQVECLMLRAAALDGTYNQGGPHLFLGVYYSARPKQLGGDPDKAREHFEKALAIAGDDFLLTKVYFAKYYARQIFDRELYERTLKQVLAADVSGPSDAALLNAVARRRAKQLLDDTDEYF